MWGPMIPANGRNTSSCPILTWLATIDRHGRCWASVSCPDHTFNIHNYLAVWLAWINHLGGQTRHDNTGEGEHVVLLTAITSPLVIWWPYRELQHEGSGSLHVSIACLTQPIKYSVFRNCEPLFKKVITDKHELCSLLLTSFPTKQNT